MAQATATCTCKYCGGTFYRIKDFPSRKSADDWEAWVANNITVCNACAEKRRREEREKENADAAQESESIGLPQLTGSVKQIAWATTIRMKFVQQIRVQMETVEKRLNEPDASDRAKKMLRAMKSDVTILLSHTAAAWWIENRDYKLKDIMRISKMRNG